jgi:hypothetical protein
MASLAIDTRFFFGRIAACVAASLALHLVAVAVFEISSRTHAGRTTKLIVPVELRFAPSRQTTPASQTAKPSAAARANLPVPTLNLKQPSRTAPHAALGALWSDVCRNFNSNARKKLNMPDCAPTKRKADKAAIAALRARTQDGLETLALREGWGVRPPPPKIIADPAKARGAALPSGRILGIARPVPIVRLATDGKSVELSGLGLLGVAAPPQAPVTAVTRLADDYRYRAAKDRAAGATH